MDFYDLTWQMADLLEGQSTAYFYTVPETPDFSDKSPFEIVVESGRKQVRFEVTPQNLPLIVGMLDGTIFSKDYLKILFTWNLKSFLSYCRFFLKKFNLPEVSVIDLKVIESFLNLDKSKPENFIEAVNRSKVISGFRTWKPIYKAIHLPLMFHVLPDLETVPLISEEVRKAQYAYYEIEGQTNGRMNSYRKYHNGYLPYTLSPEQKQIMKPKDYMDFFSADYRACEVYVLQWLSKDPLLAEIIVSGKDIYGEIYKAITGDNCDTENKRNLCKKMFLPVMFGCGVKGLAANLQRSEDLAKELLRRIYQKFVVAVEWMQARQEEADQRQEAEDFFGRTRKLAQGESYLARNFVVQGAAATFCQEKLIALHKALQNRLDAMLCFSIHDGYVGCCTSDAARDVYRVVKDSLESPSELCPGLAVKTRVTFGPKLNDLKVLWTD